MNKEQQELKQKLMSLGLPKSSCKRYVCGDWTIPDKIKELIEENEKKE